MIRWWAMLIRRPTCRIDWRAGSGLFCSLRRLRYTTYQVGWCEKSSRVHFPLPLKSSWESFHSNFFYRGSRGRREFRRDWFDQQGDLWGGKEPCHWNWWEIELPFFLLGVFLEFNLNFPLRTGIQNFPEGLAVSLPLHASGFSLGRSFWYGQLSGMVEPIFGVLGECVWIFNEKRWILNFVEFPLLNRCTCRVGCDHNLAYWPVIRSRRNDFHRSRWHSSWGA